jgi:ribose transport system substrate-binding protein
MSIGKIRGFGRMPFLDYSDLGVVTHMIKWPSRSVRVCTAVALTAVLAGFLGSGSVSASSQARPVSKSAKIHIAFFGFETSNSFAQAGWIGVQKAAKQYHGTATFLNGNFDPTTQDNQMTDAIAEHKYNVFVVEAYGDAEIVPYVRRAIKAGISVVAEYAPIGSNFTTDKPQVPGLISVVDVPKHNGMVLGQMGIAACGNLDPCQVAFLIGNTTSPLDVVRSQEVESVLKSDPKVDLVATPVAGYVQATGETTAQEVLAAHPDLNVMIGSSQAIEGAQIYLQQAGKLNQVKLVGNGGSTQAVDAVKAGKWFGTYFEDEPAEAYLATKLAIEKYQGKKVQTAVNSASIGPVGKWLGDGTRAHLKGVSGTYSDY